MSVTDNRLGRGGVKTLAIRLEPDLHAQLSLIAQLRGSTITDEIRGAIEAHVIRAKTAPELVSRAGSALEEIERDALARRAALAGLFGPSPETPDSGSSRSRSHKATDGNPSVS
jgi:predicted DNA-binding protein